MKLSYTSYLTLALVLLTFCVSVCQGQRRACDLSSRPHPDGICGHLLSRAHSNLCFLLRQAYPEHFGKRSTDYNLRERILNVPLSTLAELELSLDNWDVLFNKRDTPLGILNTEALLSDEEYRPHQGKRQPVESDGNQAETLLQLLKEKGSDRWKRNVPQSSMVCDCCYNVCTTRHLATYC
ncbi:hypothetical protein BsWGS_12829 [Bradybaena similaris]